MDDSRHPRCQNPKKKETSLPQKMKNWRRPFGGSRKEGRVLITRTGKHYPAKSAQSRDCSYSKENQRFAVCARIRAGRPHLEHSDGTAQEPKRNAVGKQAKLQARGAIFWLLTIMLKNAKNVCRCQQRVDEEIGKKPGSTNQANRKIEAPES